MPLRPTPLGPDTIALPTVQGTPDALDINGLPAMPAAYQGAQNLPDMPQSAEETRKRVIDAMMSRSDADLGKRKDQVNSDLIARGLRPGTEAYTREMDTLERARNDARQQAEIAGGDAAAQAFAQDLSRRQQGYGEATGDATLRFQQGMGIRGMSAQEQNQRFSQLMGAGAQRFGQEGQRAELDSRLQANYFSQQSENRRQAIAEMMARRSTPINEITALMSGSQVGTPAAGAPGGPGFNPSSVAPAPIFAGAQARNQYDRDLYGAEVSQANQTNSSLASAAMMAMYFF